MGSPGPRTFRYFSIKSSSQSSEHAYPRGSPIPYPIVAGTFTSPSNPLAVVDNKCTIAAMIRLNAVSLGVNLEELPPDGTENFFAIDK